ncbi:hypothetical protein HGRIS_002935 [Hohenbuehelia grisea]|uniref:BZIP domain-containing protein n=1 Tax=Hohenbuehelia grisea TaxID=104357 RepID=A0ABR3JLZ3_9AGAR
MPPPNLLGLNVVQPLTHDSDSQDLLAGHSFPELDLWANLAFENEDSHPPGRDDDSYGKKVAEDEDDEDSGLGVDGATAIHDGHINVVTGTNIGTNAPAHPPTQHEQPQPSFDLNSLLSSFGNPFALPSFPPSQLPAASAPSLVQLLALHSAQAQMQAFPAPSPSSTTALPPPAATSTDAAPPAKRARTRKASVTVSTTSLDSPTNSQEPSTPNTTTPPAAAEDKRRRNTAASARFRLKKKEREAALESKAKELEVKVNELERECEGLRRENGWLKGLVVGVTGAAAQGPVTMPVTLPPSVGAVSLSGSKRSRDESDV